MSRYEERLERDLEAIRDGLRQVGELVHTALQRSVHALLIYDREVAGRVILEDLPINRAVRRLDERCHEFVARHLPSAGHLRFISSSLRLNVELERIGDYAVTIARETVQLSGPPPEPIRRNIELVGDQAREMFRQAMHSFYEGNADLARGTKGMARQIERMLQKLFRELTEPASAGPEDLHARFAHLIVLTRLGRVSDQSKNICEETVFAVTGETKEPKVYRVLFVDRHGDQLSQMARAYAEKAFAEAGQFSAAGIESMEALHPQVEFFLDYSGYDCHDLSPSPLPSPDQLDDFHVIVSMVPDLWKQVSNLPFRTVLLHWDVETPPRDLDQERAQATLGQAHREISSRVQDLMSTLRGSREV